MTQKDEKFRSGFIAIVGRPNVGKSTLLNAMVGEKIAITSNKPQTTRNRILGISNVPGGQLLFLDTPGIHKAKGRLNRYMVDQAVSACSGVDLVFFLVEATDSPGGGDDYILDMLSKTGKQVVLVINKIDLLEKDKLLPLINVYSERFPFSDIVPVSALKNDGVKKLASLALGYLPEGPNYYPEDMITDMPERFIVAEMIREQVLKKTRDEVPYGVAVVVESFTEKPEKNLIVIQALVAVEREPHKRIILGKGGAMIRAIGETARKEIERFLDSRVFLELFVRVEKKWTESGRHLKEFGYH